MTNIGSEIRRLREERGMTQQELAWRAGISNTTMYKTEVGKTEPRLSIVEKLAAALGVDPAEILFPKAAAPQGSPNSEGGTHTHRTARSHMEPLTARSSATVTVDRELLHNALEAVGAGTITPESAERQLLVGADAGI
jgi:DNA-binding XRE family transcriptional regulator